MGELNTQADHNPLASRKAVGAAVMGNLLEWYDFAIYGYLATIIARNFFPQGDETTALLSAFATFGVGFVMRPLGGIVIGRLGDVRGRKTALMLTIFMMAFGTVLIGLIPTYDSIGLWAPALLVVARLVQGFATGGEWGSSTAFIVEWAPKDKRGLYGSFQQSSLAAGLLLGSGIAALFSTVLTPDDMESWGWRIPFLFGGILAPVGIYMRRNIDETPAFRKAQSEVTHKTATHKEVTHTAAPSPLVLAGKAFGFTVLWTSAYYMMLAYMPTFTQLYVGLTRSEALWSNTLGLLVLVLVIPFAGALSDRIGRKPLLITCCLSFVLLTHLLFNTILAQGSLAVVIGAQVLFALMIASFSGPGPAAISEIFPTRLRTTWMSAGYSLAVAIFGGFAPFIATWLIARTGSPLSPTWYVISAAVISTLVILRLPETAHKELA
jgi:MHS family proline/betaine transporter-like MFS transporter